jgi:acyl-CoA thioesterase FadM
MRVMTGWIETYRGTVYRWEVDQYDHFTVAYYFQRFGHASLTLLTALGLGIPYVERARRGCVAVDCYVRYLRELSVGDIMHMTSGVIAVEADAFVAGGKLFNSENGALCATVEQRLAHVDLDRRSPVPLSTEQRWALEARRVDWDGPPRERRPQPLGLQGFRDTTRDTVEPGEIDATGHVAMSHYIHRFSAANGHATAAFGMTPAYMREERRGFSTFEFQLTFAGTLSPGDPVPVRSALLHVGSSSLRVFHKMFNERTGELVATLDQFAVHLDMDARRPVPLPDALREQARAILAPTEPS